mmetsp:Transcript_28816/g.79421  ORF Transcript_28816/g.79421 Transcript_28816/m.79421 type:complete len:228 (-) Transcript_28816:215-898(-)
MTSMRRTVPGQARKSQSATPRVDGEIPQERGDIFPGEALQRGRITGLERPPKFRRAEVPGVFGSGNGKRSRPISKQRAAGAANEDLGGAAVAHAISFSEVGALDDEERDASVLIGDAIDHALPGSVAHASAVALDPALAHLCTEQVAALDAKLIREGGGALASDVSGACDAKNSADDTVPLELEAPLRQQHHGNMAAMRRVEGAMVDKYSVAERSWGNGRRRDRLSV